MPIGHSPYGYNALGDLTGKRYSAQFLSSPGYERSALVQKIMNYYPAYMRGRSDKYSTYQQLIASIAGHFDQLNSGLKRQLANRFPQTYMPDTLDLVYVHEAPKPPLVEYLNEGVWTEIKPSTKENPEDWWYNSVPDSIKVISDRIPPTVLIDRQTIKRKFSCPNLRYPTGLYVILEAVEANFINNIKGETVLGTEIRIYGIDEYDQEREEVFTFFYASSKRSKTCWKRVDQIECTYWDSPEKLTLTVGNYYPEDYNLREDYIYSQDQPDGQVKGVFWDYTGNRLLLKYFAAMNILDYHAGVKDIETVRDWVLLQDNLTPLQSIESILPSETDTNIYVLADGKLLAYSKLDTFSSMAKLSSSLRTADAAVHVSVDSTLGRADIKGIFAKESINRRIQQYRFSVIKDGVRFYYHDGLWTEDDSFTQYNNIGQYGFVSPEIVYTEDSYFSEDLMFVIDIKTEQGIETDTCIVDRQVKVPLFSIAYTTDEAAQLGISEDGFLSIIDIYNYNKIELQSTTYLYDNERSLIIFRDGYPTVRTTEEIRLTPVNVFGEIDQHGAIVSLERKLGEKGYQFRKRLLDSYYRSASSALTGMIYGISRELVYPVTDTLEISHPEDFNLEIKSPYVVVDFADNSYSLNMFKYTEQEIGQDLFGTIADFIFWLEGLGFTVNILDTLSRRLPIRSLLNTFNIQKINNLIITGSSRSELHIPMGAKLIPNQTKISEFQYCETEEDLNNLKEPGFTVILPNTVILNRTAEIANKLSYAVRYNRMILKSSRVIISNILDNSENFSFGYISENVKDLINQTEIVSPTKWID